VAENTKIETIIAEYFKHDPDVCAVYLFGSYASGKQGHFSDIDIAVVFNNTDYEDACKKKENYSLELSRLTRKDIHLSILNFSNENLAKQIFMKGKCVIVNKPKALSQFKMVKFAQIADFNYYYNKFKRRLIQAVMKE
jgi:predicted nucleotidyltransferase